jgi:hypothetical protein
MNFKKAFPIVAVLLIVFLMGCNKKDDIPGVRPEVTSTNPISEAGSIGISSQVSAIFSVAMNPSTINAANFTLKQGTTAVAGTVVYSGTTATFTPSANLSASSLYSAKISMAATDESGLGLAEDYTWSFTTGGVPDLVKPTVTLTDPINNAVGVLINKQIKVTFSEAMDVTTITSLTYTLNQETNSVTGTVTYTGTIGTFTPSADLEYSKVYTVKVSTGAKDLSNNSILADYTFTFTTIDAPDVTLPMVNLTDPLNNATDIAVNKVVEVTFSEAMTESTINGTTFTLNQGLTPVTGTVAYSGMTATFTPTNPLEGNKEYTATVTTGAKDLSNNALAANVVWKFTTLTPVLASAVNLGTAADFVVFSNTAIANPNANSSITGNIGAGPGVTSTAITGFSLILPAGSAFSTSSQVVGGGKVYAFDYAVPSPTYVNTASNDMLTAYTDAAGRAPSYTELYAGDISGKTLTSGVYKWSNSVVINSDVTLQGSATDIWIFEISGDLTVAAGGSIPTGIKVVLSGGALASNIYWQVGGLTGATLGTYSTFNGIILSAKQIIMNTGAVLNGKALAATQVSLDASVIQP